VKATLHVIFHSVMLRMWIEAVQSHSKSRNDEMRMHDDDDDDDDDESPNCGFSGKTSELYAPAESPCI
jgi:hypothetical protein